MSVHHHNRARRFLIVNADDFGLSPGVSEGILEAHERGIVMSTTCLVNLDFPDSFIRKLKRAKPLGVGLHLNVVYGPPVCSKRSIPSLVDTQGVFRHRAFSLRRVGLKDIEREYRAQIERFRKKFGRKPTHLDTHYHLHGKPSVFAILKKLAREFRLPFRPPYLTDVSRTPVAKRNREGSVQWLFGSLRPDWNWTVERLEKCLETLPEGASELVTHPGRSDRLLRRISTLSERREAELKALTSHEIKKWIRKSGIRLVQYGTMQYSWNG